MDPELLKKASNDLSVIAKHSIMTNDLLSEIKENLSKISGLSAINDTLCRTNVELRSRLGEYEKAAFPDPVTDKKKNIKLIEYGLEYIISGDTYEYKDIIKEKFNARWNTDPKGWIVENKFKTEIEEFFSAENNVTFG